MSSWPKLRWMGTNKYWQCLGYHWIHWNKSRHIRKIREMVTWSNGIHGAETGWIRKTEILVIFSQ
jgi:hypothetical protein